MNGVDVALKVRLMKRRFAPMFLTLERVRLSESLYEFWTVGEDEKGHLRRLHGYYDDERGEVVIVDNQPLSYNA
jgi:hypothetical protein